jgi:hypothetical protein
MCVNVISPWGPLDDAYVALGESASRRHEFLLMLQARRSLN